MLKEDKSLLKKGKERATGEFEKVIIYSAKLLQKKLNYMIADCEQRLDLRAGTSRSHYVRCCAEGAGRGRRQLQNGYTLVGRAVKMAKSCQLS